MSVPLPSLSSGSRPATTVRSETAQTVPDSCAVGPIPYASVPPVADSFRPVYVVGGRQREDRSLRDLGDGWYGYGTGVILEVSPSGVKTVKEYVSKPGTHGPDDAVLFKCASRVGDRMYCSTQTEIVVFSLPDFAEIAHVSLPRFNDVHHVLPTGRGTALVANSGLETVIEIRLADGDADDEEHARDGEVVREWNVLGLNTWTVHDPDVDYRIGVSTKPHAAHPNHVFTMDGEPWATRFERRDAISLDDPDRRIHVGTERVHDGVVHDGAVYFTTVDATIVAAGVDDLEVRARWSLDDGGDSDEILGWCRGLCFVDHGCWVGFSRIRPTRLRSTVSWIRQRGSSQAPTRIALYSPDDWRLRHEVDLEPHDLNAVFSIIPA